MQPLLSKTTRPFILYVLIVLAVSVPVYYFVVDYIWRTELDEHNRILADKTAYGLNDLKLTDEQLEESIGLWNAVQPGTNIVRVKKGQHLADSTYTIDKQKNYSKAINIDRFRCLRTHILINGDPYLFTVETNLEESREIIAVISLIAVFFFVLIVIGLLLLTRRLSATIWAPFHNTLETLNQFNLDKHTKVQFKHTTIKEFEELNQSLKSLIEQNVLVYKTQKDFTENASHELQTPLAVLRSKMDLLLQSDDLTENQYHLAESMNRALIRSSRITKDLLLLAKIENNQYDHEEQFELTPLLEQSKELLQDHLEQKRITVTTRVDKELSISGNKALTEILINNLFINAIRHSPDGSSIWFTLTDNKLEVANTGEHSLNQDLLFKRFSKLSGESAGSGLGLSIIKEICKVHEWDIRYRFEQSKHIFSVIF